MLPLTQRDSVRNVGRLSRIRESISGWLRLILSDKNSRNILLFLMLNFSFAFVELFYGIWTNSLGLISDSFHMFFDCTGLLAGLAASVITKWKANENYSYGYVRAEVLAGMLVLYFHTNSFKLLCFSLRFCQWTVFAVYLILHFVRSCWTLHWTPWS